MFQQWYDYIVLLIYGKGDMEHSIVLYHLLTDFKKNCDSLRTEVLQNIVIEVIYMCPNKSARFNFVTNAPFIQKVLIFFFQYKVHTLRLIVEHNIRQMSPTTLLAHSCSFDEILDDLSAYLRLSFANDTSNLRLELRNCLWFVDTDTRFHEPPKNEVARCQTA